MTINLTRRQFGRTAAGIAAATTVGAPLSALAAKKLSYANAGNATTNSNTFAKAWLDEVTKRTGGDLTFQMFTGTKGGEKDLLDGVALGTIDIYNGAYTGTREFDILYSPYFFRAGNHACRPRRPLGAFHERKTVLVCRPQGHENSCSPD